MSALPLSAVHIRPEGPGDAARIRQINELAFEGTTEAALIDALRASGAVTLSMVAVIGGQKLDEEETSADVPTWGGDGANWGGGTPGVLGGEVVAHALVTPVSVTTEHGEVSLLGLGPVAVLPAEQGQGIGTLLVETVLEHLRASGYAGVVVVGQPEYYHRFGFIPAASWGLRWEMEAPEEAFMALELSPGLLAGIGGVVRYRPEFTEEPVGQ